MRQQEELVAERPLIEAAVIRFVRDLVGADVPEGPLDRLFDFLLPLERSESLELVFRFGPSSRLELFMDEALARSFEVPPPVAGQIFTKCCCLSMAREDRLETTNDLLGTAIEGLEVRATRAGYVVTRTAPGPP
jgi:hypothetical protein